MAAFNVAIKSSTLDGMHNIWTSAARTVIPCLDFFGLQQLHIKTVTHYKAEGTEEIQVKFEQLMVS